MNQGMGGAQGSGGQQSAWDAQNAAAAGNPGAGEAYRAVREWGEFDKPRRRGLAYGDTDPVTDGLALDRMKRFCPDWDGDMRWPPPGFLEREAALTRRADEFERMDLAAMGYHGPSVGSSDTFVTPLAPVEAHQLRCQQTTQQAFARHDAWMADMQSRADADRRRQDAARAADRHRQDTQQNAAQNRDHARQMQQAQLDHEYRMRKMEIEARHRGWGR